MRKSGERLIKSPRGGQPRNPNQGRPGRNQHNTIQPDNDYESRERNGPHQYRSNNRGGDQGSNYGMERRGSDARAGGRDNRMQADSTSIPR